MTKFLIIMMIANFLLVDILNGVEVFKKRRKRINFIVWFCVYYFIFGMSLIGKLLFPLLPIWQIPEYLLIIFFILFEVFYFYRGLIVYNSEMEKKKKGELLNDID